MAACDAAAGGSERVVEFITDDYLAALGWRWRVTALVVAVCVLASCILAWRGSTLDPLAALRSD